MFWTLAIIAVVLLFYFFMVRPMQYWSRKGVKQGSLFPIPLLGDNWGPLLKLQSFADMVVMVYNQVPSAKRYSGMYQFTVPTLVLKDPELIKQITIKDFDHFIDHRAFIPEDSDPLWAKNLFALTGKRWRDMRATLSPAFTGSKMKFMFTLISQSGEQFIKHFLDQNQNEIELEMKDTCTRFTNDVIANTAFGIECDSLKDRDNEFFLMGKMATNFSGFWKNLRFFSYFIMPKLAKLLKVRLFDTEVADFFCHLVKTNIESREKHNISRPDMIHLLLQARKNGIQEDAPLAIDTGFSTVQEFDIGTKLQKNHPIKITDEDITSQALIFFFAGFDSVSSLMCFMSHELGVNQDVQERLVAEIDEVREKCNGKLTYEALLGMKYMDMVVSESLRKWPNAIAVDRLCTKPYTIEPIHPDEKPVKLEKNDVLWLPIYALHRDPKFYPEPLKFDPERFNDENKNSIPPYAYLPFGSGPRNCIGSRFALLETKTLFFYILSEFQIVPVAKTQIPLKLSKKSFNMNAENGFWLAFKRRNKV